MHNDLTKEEILILLKGLLDAAASGYNDSLIEHLELICKLGYADSLDLSMFQKESNTLIKSLIQAHNEGYDEASTALHEVYMLQIYNASSAMDYPCEEEKLELASLCFWEALGSYNVETDGDLSQYIYDYIVKELQAAWRNKKSLLHFKTYISEADIYNSSSWENL